MRILDKQYKHYLGYWLILLIAIASLAAISLAKADTVVNTYDSLNRITKIQYDNGRVVEYAYDSAGNRSQRAVVNINQAPVANAGAAQSITLGVQVTLNGSASGDPDNGPSPLTYTWSRISGPATVTLSSTTAVNPTFTPTQAGDYVFG